MNQPNQTKRRPVTLFTGQWANLSLAELAPKAVAFGFDGLELACWGDHFEVSRAVVPDIGGDCGKAYCTKQRGLLKQHGLDVWAISAHLVGQAVCDNIDDRHRAILPPHVWGDGNPEGVRQRAAKEMMDTARAAKALGVKVVNGFTGSSIWHLLYSFPPVPQSMIDAGFEDFAKRWIPILDVFDECGVDFCLEVHPTEIAFDFHTAEKAIEAVGGHKRFKFNFDPSHIQWQGVRPSTFIRAFKDRIGHVHMKDCAVTLDGRQGILGSMLPFGDSKRGWNFVSLGHGDVDFERIIRALNDIGYAGPLSVEWEDSGMDREHGAAEACQFVRRVDFPKSGQAFDAAFDGKK